jgi:hypothetical protein
MDFGCDIFDIIAPDSKTDDWVLQFFATNLAQNEKIAPKTIYLRRISPTYTRFDVSTSVLLIQFRP